MVWSYVPTAENMEPKRARNDKGHYKKDDPATPENEAWVGGKAPAAPKKTKKATTTKKRSTTTKKTNVAKKRKPRVKKDAKATQNP